MLKKCFSLILIFGLASCADPIPPGQKEYVGLWKNQKTTLLITQDGSLDYKTRKGGVSTSISMPVKSISDSNIEAGFLFFSANFELSGKPVTEDGVTRLVVDGETLFKADESGNVTAARKAPSMQTLRKLVRQDLVLLSQGIMTSDFTAYLNNASLVFQSQFDNEKLKQAYQSMIDRKVDLSDFLKDDFVLTAEPFVNEQGVLKVVGEYKNEEATLSFTLSYVYAYPGWKSVGANLQLN